MYQRSNPVPLSCLLYFLIYNVLYIQHSNQEDIIIGGIFSTRFPRMSKNLSADVENLTCGEHNIGETINRLAMKFAVSEINNRDDLLPGIKLGTSRASIKETCSDLEYAVKSTLQYDFIKARFVSSSDQCKSRGTDNQCCLLHDGDTPPVAIIAGAYSHIVKAIVNLVGLFKVPVISYKATSPSLNKLDYFLRTITPDTITTRVMVDIINKLNWDIVQVVYIDNEFGHYAADGFRTAIRHSKPKICIAYDDKFSIDSGKTEIKRVVNGIQNATKSRVIAFFGTTEDFVYFQRQSVGLLDMSQYVWISSELWISPDLVKSALDQPRSRSSQRNESIKHILTIIPDQVYPVHRFIQFLSESGLKNPADQLRNTTLIPLVIDAVYSIAVGMHNSLGCEIGISCWDKLKNHSKRLSLHDLKNVSVFNNLTNKTISFDDDSNPLSANFNVVKLEIANNGYETRDIGKWMCHRSNCTGQLVIDISNFTSSFNSKCGHDCGAGFYKAVEEEFRDCCWTCEKCIGKQYTNESDQLRCLDCQDHLWPNVNHTACDNIEHDYLDLSSAAGLLILVWDCLGIAVILVTVCVFLKYSTSPIVKASSKALSLLLLLGIFMDFTVLIASLREPNRTQCTIMFIISNATNCLVTGTLLLKTNRIHRIFRKSAMTERPRCLSNVCQLLIIFILVLVSITLCVTLLIFYPDHGDVTVTYYMSDDTKKAFIICNFLATKFKDNVLHVLVWSYNCGLVFICTYQAYLVRKVPENYNEARYITFTMVTISMNFVVYLITTSGMDEKNIVLVFCVFQSLEASVALVCMYLYKIYIIMFHPEQNVTHNPVQSKLGTFVEHHSAIVHAEAHANGNESAPSSVSSEGFPRDIGGVRLSHPTGRRPFRKVGMEGEDDQKNAVEFDDLQNKEPIIT